MKGLSRFLANRWVDFVGKLLLSILSGLLIVLACTKYDIWPLGWMGLFPLLMALFGVDGQPRTRYPFFWGWITGTVTVAGGFPWITGLLEKFAPEVTSASIPLFLVFSLYHGLVFALFSKLVCFLKRELSVSFTWLVAIAWTTCEFVFPTIFPWYIAITQAWVLPVIQISEIAGVLGVSFVLALASGALFEVYSHLFSPQKSQKNWRGPLAAGVLIPCCFLYGFIRIYQVDQTRKTAPSLSVGMVQSNVSMEYKFKKHPDVQLLKLQQASADLEKQGVDLIVWPESAYPIYYSAMMQRFQTLPHTLSMDLAEGSPWKIRNHFSTPLLFGSMTSQIKLSSRFNGQGTTVDEDLFNSAFLLMPNGQITGRMDKNNLMPFSESTPFHQELAPLWEKLHQATPTIPGKEPTLFPFPHQGRLFWIAPSVCLDAIVSSFYRKQLLHPSVPNLLVNITNDAWFGNTAEPYQHLALAVFRSVEHRLDMVRATNTGVSAIIEATGRISAQTSVVDPKNIEEPAITLRHSVRLLTASSFYARYGHVGGWICLGITILLGLVALRRARKPLRWSFLLLGSMSYHLALVAAGLLGKVPVSTLYSVLLHDDSSVFPSDLLFRCTWLIALAMMLQSAVLGFTMELVNQHGAFSFPPRKNMRLERVLSLLVTTVLPVVLWGKMDGNTAIVATITLLCVGSGFLGEGLSRFWRSKKARPDFS